MNITAEIKELKQRVLQLEEMLTSVAWAEVEELASLTEAQFDLALDDPVDGFLDRLLELNVDLDPPIPEEIVEDEELRQVPTESIQLIPPGQTKPCGRQPHFPGDISSW